MGKATRIRWQNLAKLAGGVVAGIALVAGLPALLERPKPPPLPPDVGLAGVADGSPAASLSVARKGHHRPAPRDEREEHPDRAHGKSSRPQHRAAPEKPDHHRKSAEPQPTPVPASAPAGPAPPPPAASPAPAPAYSPPPPAPAPAPVATSSRPTTPPSGGGDGGEGSAPSEFGFER